MSSAQNSTILGIPKKIFSMSETILRQISAAWISNAETFSTISQNNYQVNISGTSETEL